MSKRNRKTNGVKKSGMLVLTRHTGEFVRITVPPSQTETQISVCLTSIRGGIARIGFIAPRPTAIGREELYTSHPTPPLVADACTDMTSA